MMRQQIVLGLGTAVIAGVSTLAAVGSGSPAAIQQNGGAITLPPRAATGVDIACDPGKGPAPAECGPGNAGGHVVILPNGPKIKIGGAGGAR